jgi:ATP phosphoribosyltransferase
MHGIQVYRIVESLGATEGAPAAGSADVIVDITTTGSTLRANHLRSLDDGVILKSQACLVSAKRQRPAADAAVLAEVCRRVREAVA